MLIKSFKEEYKNFLTNKINLVVLFVIPILTVILMGAELSKEVITDIPIAVINYDNSAFSNQLIDAFDQNDTFNVVRYPDNEQELEDLMRNSKVRMGIVIPEDFYNDILRLKSPTVLMLYDGSHMSITSTSKSKATEILLTYKAGATISQLKARLGIQYEEAYNIAQAFQFRNRVLYNPLKSFEDFLAPMLMAGCIHVALALSASVAFNHDIYYEKKKKRVGYATGKILFYTLATTISFIICILLQVFVFEMPFRGNFISALILSAALSFSVSAFCILISIVIKNRMIALVGSGVVFIPNSIMAGTTWPLISMPVGYQAFVKYVPFTHYVNNIRNVYLKGTSLSQMMSDINYMVVFGVIILVICEVVVFVRETDKEKELNDNGVLGGV